MQQGKLTVVMEIMLGLWKVIDGNTCCLQVVIDGCGWLYIVIHGYGWLWAIIQL